METGKGGIMFLVEYQFVYHFRSNCITSRNASKGVLTDVMHLDRFDCRFLRRKMSLQENFDTSISATRVYSL